MADEDHVYVEVLLRIKGSPVTNHIVDIRVPNNTVPLTDADTEAAPEATVKLRLDIPALLRLAADAAQKARNEQGES